MQANERENQANQKCAMLEDKMKSMEQILVMPIEQQQGDTSTGTSHVHPCYARKFGDQFMPLAHHFVSKIQLSYMLQHISYQLLKLFNHTTLFMLSLALIYL